MEQVEKSRTSRLLKQVRVSLFVTGGAGCLGSQIVHHFESRFDRIVVFDNLATGDRSWLQESDKVIFVEGDVADIDAVEEAFQRYRPTHVIHGAASYADADNWSGDAATNALGTLHVVKASEKLDVGTFIYLQTALGYGRPDSTPIPITHPLRPQTSYGISKVAGELYVLGAELPKVFSFRLANVCAPRLSIGPFPTFFKKILSNEPSTVSDAERDFLDIEDFLSLLELAISSKAACKRAFNVSTGVGHSIGDLYRAIESALDTTVGAPTVIAVGDDDVKSVVLDPSDTQDYFGWVPQKAFDEIVKRQVMWFKEIGVGEIRSHLRSHASKAQS